MTGSTSTRINVVLLVALLFGQLLLMAGSLRGSAVTAAVEEGARRGSGPLLSVASTVGRSVSGAFGVFRAVGVARREVSELRQEISRLEMELDRHREAALENRRLRALLGMRQDLAPRSVGASVVAAALTGQSRVLVVDVGSASSVTVDLAAVGWGGAVGRVIAVGRDHAKVRVLTDPWSRVAGVVQRSRVEGIVVGRGDALLEMAYVPRYADVAVGDRVVTSGLDGVFPRGFGIGRVASVRDTSGVTKAVEIVPDVEFGALEEMLILLDSAAAATRLTAEDEPR